MSIFSVFIFYIVAYLFVILSYLPSLIGTFNGFFPLFETALVFFFIAHTNRSINYLFLLIIFIMLDTIQHNIIGTNALIFFLTIIIFKMFSKLFYFEKFSELWLGYSVFCILVFGLSFIIKYFVQEYTIISHDILIKLLLTIAFYPFFDFILGALYDRTILKYHNEKYLI